MKYTWYFNTGGIAGEGIEIEADTLKEAAESLIQKLRSEHSEFLFTAQDIEDFAKDSGMSFSDYANNYGYKKIDGAGTLYARFKGMTHDNKLFVF